MTNWLILGSGETLDLLPRHLPEHGGWRIACVNASIKALMAHERWPDAYGIFEYKCGKIFQPHAVAFKAANPQGRLIVSTLAMHGGGLHKNPGNLEVLSSKHLPESMWEDVSGYRTSGALMLAILAAEVHHSGGGRIHVLGFDGYRAGSPYAKSAGGPEYGTLQANQINTGATAYIAGVIDKYSNARIRTLEASAYPIPRA